jgi:hypothetical protein
MAMVWFGLTAFFVWIGMVSMPMAYRLYIRGYRTLGLNVYNVGLPLLFG